MVKCNDINKLQKEIDEKQQELDALNSKINEMKNSLMKERCELLLDAMIVGAGTFKVRHGMSAPYTHSYYVRSPLCKGFCQPVTSRDEWYKKLPEKLYNYLITQCDWDDSEFKLLESEVKAAWDNLPKGYNDVIYKRVDGDKYSHHIANGYESDGFYHIMMGECHGTYSSMTTCTQNELSRELIVLKGYCADLYFEGIYDEEFRECVEKVYARHGIDNDFSDLREWSRRNPTRCSAESEFYIKSK